MICASLTLLQIMFAVHRFRSRGDSGSAAKGGGGALRAQIIKKPARTTVISTEAERSGEISLRNVASPWWQEISRLRVSIEPKVFVSYRCVPPLEMTMPAGSIQSFAEGQIDPNAALTAKRRPAWVEWSFEALAVQHPRATLWPSPPRWEACHLILSRLRLPANQVPLPPQGGAWRETYHQNKS